MNLKRRASLAIATAAGAALVLAPAASADLWSPESGGSPNADSIDSLYWVTMVIGTVISVGVLGLLMYTLFKFRASKGAIPRQVRGNNKLEFTWTIAATLIVVFIAGYTYSKLDEITNPADSIAEASARVEPAAVQLSEEGQLHVCVTGFQFGWRFIYQTDPCTDTHKRNISRVPGPQDKLYSYEEMVVPVGVTVRIWIGSLDVNHAWWIPKLGGKRDATRGYLIESWFRVPPKFGEKPGGTVFFGQCAELCGRNHANMTARVRAVSAAEFNSWAKKKRLEIAADRASLPELAKQVQAN
jgi:cytochrome c oxidase subunit 2